MFGFLKRKPVVPPTPESKPFDFDFDCSHLSMGYAIDVALKHVHKTFEPPHHGGRDVKIELATESFNAFVREPRTHPLKRVQMPIEAGDLREVPNDRVLYHFKTGGIEGLIPIELHPEFAACEGLIGLHNGARGYQVLRIKFAF